MPHSERTHGELNLRPSILIATDIGVTQPFLSKVATDGRGVPNRQAHALLQGPSYIGRLPNLIIQVVTS
ncbi:hypothetical protein TIFTF001_056241 [Ficus carica]|uniref:Uncharacterized protein n=1 Tax=Ficus carica TaxID=3494 RepID=A0AA88EIB4_FICCA|nr:hypothetical protein TIFTF001_056241 [Ficus carica]